MKTKVWGLPTRVFHWMLVVGIIGALALAEGHFRLHVALGSMAGMLLLFRVIWGFIGPRYSRFSDFKVGKAAFIDTYIKKEVPPGHNPLASIVITLIILAGLFTVVSGFLAYFKKGRGMFYFRGDVFEELHEFFVVVLLVLVGIHLLGIVIDHIYNREMGTLSSIFTGIKNVKGEDAHLTPGQKAFSWGWIASAIVVFSFLLSSPYISRRGYKTYKYSEKTYTGHGKKQHKRGGWRDD